MVLAVTYLALIRHFRDERGYNPASHSRPMFKRKQRQILIGLSRIAGIRRFDSGPLPVLRTAPARVDDEPDNASHNDDGN
jgi:hypothetical protein